MKRICTVAVTGLLLLNTPVTNAGSPDGLQLVIIGGPAASAYQPRISQYFKDYDADPTGFDCDNHQLNIGAAYQAPLKAITPELAQKAISDPVHRNEIGKTMMKFRSQDYERGFDGALFYDLQEGKLMLYGISARPKKKLLATSVPVSDVGNREKFNLAMCRALSMPVLQAP